MKFIEERERRKCYIFFSNNAFILPKLRKDRRILELLLDSKFLQEPRLQDISIQAQQLQRYSVNNLKSKALLSNNISIIDCNFRQQIDNIY